MRRVLVVLLGLAALVLLWLRREAPPPPAPSPDRILLAGEPSLTESFARALSPRPFRWPNDHGPHFEYRTEWWYATGNLQAEDGRAFGYQLTIFRRGLTPGPPPSQGLATNQIYFAHLAVTDVKRGTHTVKERWSRGVPGLAEASSPPLKVSLEGWRIESLGCCPDSFHVEARDAGVSLDLSLHSRKAPVLQGDRGLSRKGRAPGNASYYVSLTRLETSGTLEAGGPPVRVSGESWLDHEWSTSALEAGAVGWDWFGLQLDDGRELMYFRVRSKDGTTPVSEGTLVEASGACRPLEGNGLSVLDRSTWRSPFSPARYPSRWSISLPEQGLLLDVRPLVRDQELRVSFTYWEGAVKVAGESHGAPVKGRGYVELTGYASSMESQF